MRESGREKEEEEEVEEKGERFYIQLVFDPDSRILRYMNLFLLALLWCIKSLLRDFCCFEFLRGSNIFA